MSTETLSTNRYGDIVRELQSRGYKAEQYYSGGGILVVRAEIDKREWSIGDQIETWAADIYVEDDIVGFVISDLDISELDGKKIVDALFAAKFQAF